MRCLGRAGLSRCRCLPAGWLWQPHLQPGGCARRPAVHTLAALAGCFWACAGRCALAAGKCRRVQAACRAERGLAGCCRGPQLRSHCVFPKAAALHFGRTKVFGHLQAAACQACSVQGLCCTVQGKAAAWCRQLEGDLIASKRSGGVLRYVVESSFDCGCCLPAWALRAQLLHRARACLEGEQACLT